MTQGPAIRSSAPLPIDRSPSRTAFTSSSRNRRCGGVPPGSPLVRVAGLDEAGEQRVWLQRLRLELGMELHRQVPWMRRQLHDFHELAVVRSTDDLEAAFRQRALVEAVELIAVTVSFL